MSEPKLRAREILQSIRDLNQPTLADRERIQDALRARLGVAVLPQQARAAPHAVRLPWPFVSTVVMDAVLLSAALLFAFRLAVRAIDLVRPAGLPVAIPGSPASAPAAPAKSIIVPISTADDSSRRSLYPAPPAEEPLAQEVTLLARAVRDLHSGRARDALKFLDEHQRKFPNGVLTEERRAARVQALCSLGRRSEAETELARLAPRSLAAVNAKQFCAASSNAER